jgi:hypothetical protein
VRPYAPDCWAAKVRGRFGGLYGDVVTVHVSHCITKGDIMGYVSDRCRVQIYGLHDDWRGHVCGQPITDRIRELCAAHSREADALAASKGSRRD